MAAIDELSQRQRHFLEWLLLPDEEKPEDVRTLAAYAALNNINPRTLSTWKNDSVKFDRVYRESVYKELASTENLQKMMLKLRAQILEGTASPSTISDYLDRLDELRPPPEIADETASVADLTDQELFSLLLRAAALRGWTVTEREGRVEISNNDDIHATFTETSKK